MRGAFKVAQPGKCHLSDSLTVRTRVAVWQSPVSPCGNANRRQCVFECCGALGERISGLRQAHCIDANLIPKLFGGVQSYHAIRPRLFRVGNQAVDSVNEANSLGRNRRENARDTMRDGVQYLSLEAGAGKKWRDEHSRPVKRLR